MSFAFQVSNGLSIFCNVEFKHCHVVYHFTLDVKIIFIEDLSFFNFLPMLILKSMPLIDAT